MSEQKIKEDQCVSCQRLLPLKKDVYAYVGEDERKVCSLECLLAWVQVRTIKEVSPQIGKSAIEGYLKSELARRVNLQVIFPKRWKYKKRVWLDPKELIQWEEGYIEATEEKDFKDVKRLSINLKNKLECLKMKLGF